MRARTSFDLVPQPYNSKLFAEISILAITTTKLFEMMKKQLESDYEKLKKKTRICYKI